MNDGEKFIFNAMRLSIWSGFSSPEDVEQMIEDLQEGDSDEEMLRAMIAPEFAKKAAAEKTWPPETDCDRLDAVFKGLNKNGIIALQNAGYTMSDGHSEVADIYHEKKKTEKLSGYCFYHGQDMERAVDGEGLYLAFGDFQDTPEGKLAVGKAVKAAFVESGFAVNWEEDPEQRICIPNFDWKRRGPSK